MYVYVCMYYMYTYVCMYMYIHIYACTYIYIHIHILVKETKKKENSDFRMIFMLGIRECISINTHMYIHTCNKHTQTHTPW